MHAVVSSIDGGMIAPFDTEDEAWEFIMHKEIVQAQDTSDLAVIEVEEDTP